jgi:hypothetical protein
VRPDDTSLPLLFRSPFRTINLPLNICWQK